MSSTLTSLDPSNGSTLGELPIAQDEAIRKPFPKHGQLCLHGVVPP